MCLGGWPAATVGHVGGICGNCIRAQGGLSSQRSPHEPVRYGRGARFQRAGHDRIMRVARDNRDHGLLLVGHGTRDAEGLPRFLTCPVWSGEVGGWYACPLLPRICPTDDASRCRPCCAGLTPVTRVETCFLVLLAQPLGPDRLLADAVLRAVISAENFRAERLDCAGGRYDASQWSFRFGVVSPH